MTVARNGAIDRLRRSSNYRAKVEELAVMATRETGTDNPEPGAEGVGVAASGGVVASGVAVVGIRDLMSIRELAMGLLLGGRGLVSVRRGYS